MSEPIRVVVIQDSDIFVAQCIEVDVAAQGKTAEEALTRLRIAYRAEADEAERCGRSIQDLGPAPEGFRAMYDSKLIERTQLVA